MLTCLRRGLFIGVVFCIGFFRTLHAAETLEPRIPAFERFFSASDGDAMRGGVLLLSELNCVACHEADRQLNIQPKQAPRLDEIGQRVRPDFLREFLSHPAQTDAGTTMPHVLHSSRPEEQRNQVEALVHFLASTSPLFESAPVTAGVIRGEKLFHTIGCIACHDSQRPNVAALPTSIPLTNLSRKYAIPGLAAFLRDPLHVRPSGRMPQFNLSPEEARDVACYLLRDLKIPTSMTFQYYEGHWDKLPDFSRLPTRASGGAASFDVNVGAADHFGVRFTGKFRVEVDGQFRFFLSSDDGARFLIDGREAIVNDGIHALQEKEAKISLTAGEHDFVVEYFEQGGEQELRVEYQGQGVKRQSLEFALVAPQAQNTAPRFAADPQLAEKGRAIFQSAGCAACHEMHHQGQRISTTKSGKRLSELRSGGCLADQPQPASPYFSLSNRQREALLQALEAIRSGQQPLQSPDARIAHTFATFNCYACHERSGKGGVEDSRNAFFQTDQPEMGDEGRIPPHLSGIAVKLQPSWLRQIFDKGAKDRTYMLTRMPKFGTANAGVLLELFATADRNGTAEDGAGDSPHRLTPDRQLKAIGRQLVGERGLSCVKCHTWGDVKATGIQAISLTTMARRLNPNWFRDYLLNPQTYRPGTRMPSAWPNGQSPFANILDGDARRQIEAVWVYLTDGNSAVMPIGIGPQPIELIAESEPIIYRNFIEGAGTRAIAVGYPQKISIAFDANDCRLALLWQGAFIDASMHWTGRGQGFQKPLGDNLLQLAEGSPLAILSSQDEPWPTKPAKEQGIQFLGYRLNAKREPAFLYRWEKCRIEDELEPVANQSKFALRRTMRLTDPPASGWFRAVVSQKIETAGEGEFVIDQDWRIKVASTSGKPVLRASQSKQELLVPIGTEIKMEVAW